MTPTPAELAEIRARHDAADNAPGDEYWCEKYAAAAHQDRATLLSILDAREVTMSRQQLCDLIEASYDAGADGQSKVDLLATLAPIRTPAPEPANQEKV